MFGFIKFHAVFFNYYALQTSLGGVY